MTRVSAEILNKIIAYGTEVKKDPTVREMIDDPDYEAADARYFFQFDLPGTEEAETRPRQAAPASQSGENG